MANESDSINFDEEPLSVSLETSSVQSELEGKDLKTNVS